MRLLILALLLVPASLPAQRDSASLLERARRLHREVPVIDTHNDLPTMIHGEAAGDLAKMNPDGRLSIDTDIPRLKAGMIGGQFFAAYVPSAYIAKGAARYALEEIDIIKRFTARSPSLQWATTADDIMAAHRNGKIASLIGIEGGHAIENSLGALRMFYELGVRYMTLTHSGTTPWADAATDAPRHGGLSPFGEDVVREMNRIGMMVDISHVSDATMLDAIRVTRAPVIFSHSSARQLTNHVRNVPDSVLALMKQNDGVVMINIFPGFINATAAIQTAKVLDKAREFQAQFPNDPDAADKAWGEWFKTRPMEPGTLNEVADHVEHVATIAGHDHVGLGADFGSLTTHPKGLEDVSRYPWLTAELLRRGWSDENVKKFLGLNILRVMRAVEKVASRSPH
jgi:membrane dipeptidase